MFSTTMWIFTAPLSLGFLLGLTTNGFVLGVNLWDWIHSLPLTTSDFYMCYLALTNFSLQICSLANWVCDISQDEDVLCLFMYAFKMTSSSSSLLLTASLCMFYCSRIVVFKYCFFQWAQRHITHYYRYFIIAAVLLCTMMGLPLAWTGNDMKNLCSSSIVKCNKTQIGYSYMNMYRTVLILFGYTMPLTYVLLAACLIFRSLINHMRRMHVTIKTGHEVRMEAHLQAGCTVMSLLLLFSVYFVISILQVIDVTPENKPLLYTYHSAPLLYSLVHSLVMIKGNGKLRRAAAGFMQKLRVVKG